MSKYSFIDLFCGAGGLSSGIESSGDGSFYCVYAIDADYFAASSHRYNHPRSITTHGDIREQRFDKLSAHIGDSVDMVVGGPPCQGFSSLRPSRGLKVDDPRNTLFREYAEFIKRFSPKIILMENVVGLATHNAGNTISSIQELLLKLGYETDWKILNAANYGVPQKRERLILIGLREGAKPEFPSPTHHFSGSVIGIRDANRKFSNADTSKLLSSLSVMDAISDLPMLKRGQFATEYSLPPQNDYQSWIRDDAFELSLHVAAKHSDKMMEVIRLAGSSKAKLPQGMVKSGYSSSYSRMDPDEPATTITVKFQSPASNKCIHPYQDRTITPREAARIQSFRDGYKFSGSLTQIASQLGNAVPPLLAKAIGDKLAELL